MFNKTWDLIECVFVEISSKKNVIIFFILIMFIPFLISVIAKKIIFRAIHPFEDRLWLS